MSIPASVPVGGDARSPESKPGFNPWPYGIVATLILFVLGVVGLIVVASADRTELVATDYYEQEIRYQTRMEQVQRTAPWDGKIAVSFDAGRADGAVVRVQLPAEHAAAGAAGTVGLYRPSHARQDRQVPLALDAEGRQDIAGADLPAGLWKVRLSWKVGADEFFAERPLVVPGGSGTGAVPRG